MNPLLEWLRRSPESIFTFIMSDPNHFSFKFSLGYLSYSPIFCTNIWESPMQWWIHYGFFKYRVFRLFWKPPLLQFWIPAQSELRVRHCNTIILTLMRHIAISEEASYIVCTRCTFPFCYHLERMK